MWAKSPSLRSCKKLPSPTVGDCSSTQSSVTEFHPSLPPDVWTTELKNDPDKNFLLDGITNGFRITDNDSSFQPIHQENYSSATSLPFRPQVEKQIRCEIDHGHYRICGAPPTIVSALGAIPKPDSDKVRLIHDCSRPPGVALNDFAPIDKLSFQTVDDATRLVTPSCFLAKVDLQWAYRSVAIHPDDYQATKFIGSQEQGNRKMGT